MTNPRIYTARRRTLQQNDTSLPANRNSIKVPSDYGSDIEIDTDLLSASAQVRTKEGDAHSDYGSDFDIEGEAILDNLLGELEGRPGVDKEEDGDDRGVAFVPKGSQDSTGATTYFSCESRAEEVVCGQTSEIEEEDRGRRTHIARKFATPVEGKGK
jgi:hypothetical protein